MRLCLTVVVLAALTPALASAAPHGVPGCRPAPGLGTLTLRHEMIDLATCAERPAGPAKASVPFATVRTTGRGRSRRDAIWVRSRPVFSIGAFGDARIQLLGWSGDHRWIFFAIGAGSTAADGLTLRVVPAAGGRTRQVGGMLAYPDYLTWCGGRLVFTAGGDREAMVNKRLLVAAPPDWRPSRLTAERGRAWGSLACAAGAVIAQSQPSEQFNGFFSTRWSLWRISPKGTQKRLTRPPAGYVDESPRVSRDGRTVMFVRSRKGHGRLYALRDGHVVGPLLPLGYSLGYYGHQDWWRAMRWSLGQRP